MNKDSKMTVTQFGDGWVVDVKDVGQSVFTEYKEVERFVGGMVMSKMGCDPDMWQIDIEWGSEARDIEEAFPVKPDVHEY